MNKSKSELAASYDCVADQYADEFFHELDDKPISIDVTLFGSDEMSGYLESAGFEDVAIVEREPYEFEYPTPRVYASAKKP